MVKLTDDQLARLVALEAISEDQMSRAVDSVTGHVQSRSRTSMLTYKNLSIALPSLEPGAVSILKCLFERLCTCPSTQSNLMQEVVEESGR